MRKSSFPLAIAIILSLITSGVEAQTPHSVNYQAVVRDTSGTPIVSQNISIRVSILSDSINGVAVYQETHTLSSNELGLITLAIGNGMPTVGASLANVNWGGTTNFLQIEIDPDAGSNFMVLSVTQMVSVPYALFAEDVALSLIHI